MTWGSGSNATTAAPRRSPSAIDSGTGHSSSAECGKWSQPLGATLDQIQTVRQYYDFTDVDTDRYVIGGVKRQVMLSARELNQGPFLPMRPAGVNQH